MLKCFVKKIEMNKKKSKLGVFPLILDFVLYWGSCPCWQVNTLLQVTNIYIPWPNTTSPHQELKCSCLLYKIILHLLKMPFSPCFLPIITSFLEKIVSLPSENVISIIFKALEYQAVIHDITDIIIHSSSIGHTHFDCACQAGIGSNIVELESE